MQRFRLSADRAFELLTRVSRVHDVTIEMLAEQILGEFTYASIRDTYKVPAESLLSPLAG